MNRDESHSLLGADLPRLPAALVTRALKVTGRWPVLLALVHGAVAEAAAAGADPATELADILDILRGTEPGEGITALDVDDFDQREGAVARTLDLSLNRLGDSERDRYLELAVFPEDVRIPIDVAATLWAHTAGWTRHQSARFCGRLNGLGLLAEYRRNPDEIVLHDVLRAYLRDRTRIRRAELDTALVNAHRSGLPLQNCNNRDGDDEYGRDPTNPQGCDWSGLPAGHYLWTWLASHLWGAGRQAELDSLLADPAWLVGQLDQVGPGRLEHDLHLSQT